MSVEDVLEDAIAGPIFEQVKQQGTIAIGDLLIVSAWNPDQVTSALGKLVDNGLVMHSGNYYSLSARGARIANKWGSSFAS